MHLFSLERRTKKRIHAAVLFCTVLRSTNTTQPSTDRFRTADPRRADSVSILGSPFRPSPEQTVPSRRSGAGIIQHLVQQAHGGDDPTDDGTDRGKKGNVSLPVLLDDLDVEGRDLVKEKDPGESCFGFGFVLGWLWVGGAKKSWVTQRVRRAAVLHTQHHQQQQRPGPLCCTAWNGMESHRNKNPKRAKTTTGDDPSDRETHAIAKKPTSSTSGIDVPQVLRDAVLVRLDARPVSEFHERRDDL